MTNGDLFIYTQKPRFWRNEVKFFGVWNDGKIAYIKNGTLRHKDRDIHNIPFVVHLPKERRHIAQACIDVGMGHSTLQLVNAIHGTQYHDVKSFLYER